MTVCVPGSRERGSPIPAFYITAGRASNINGGGGGNGLHGRRWRWFQLFGRSAGRRAIHRLSVLREIPLTGGAGGFDLGRSGYYYINGNPVNRGKPDLLWRRRWKWYAGRVTSVNTDGGNGGGIVIIVADTIVGNGHWIRADGGDVIRHRSEWSRSRWWRWRLHYPGSGRLPDAH